MLGLRIGARATKIDNVMKRLTMLVTVVILVGFLTLATNTPQAHAAGIRQSAAITQCAETPPPAPPGYKLVGVMTAPNTPAVRAYEQHHPLYATQCWDYEAFYQQGNSNGASNAGYVNCNGSSSITQKVGGGHCIVYILGECQLWQDFVWVGANCGDVQGTQAWCPSNLGNAYWNNIPSGWLVEGDLYACAYIANINVCKTDRENPIQF